MDLAAVYLNKKRLPVGGGPTRSPHKGQSARVRDRMSATGRVGSAVSGVYCFGMFTEEADVRCCQSNNRQYELLAECCEK